LVSVAKKKSTATAKNAIAKANGAKPKSAARPARLPLFEVRVSPIHGRGVFAARPIRKGTRVIEYIGEHISNDEAFERYGESIAHTMLFSIDDDTVIDPQRVGNEARFINHSCQPNCASYQDKRRIFIEAVKDIPEGAELSYDYKLIPSDTDTDRAQYPCRCGSARCRGSLLAPPRRKRPTAATKRRAATKGEPATKPVASSKRRAAASKRK
jgi:SET domain-containing protein